MEPNLQFVEEVSELSQQNVRRCYYCLRCTAGCPSAFAMDDGRLGPAQILKLVQLGQQDTLLRSSAIWMCIGCETCGTRCPNQIHAGAVIDALRQLAIDAKVAPAERKVFKLHQAFLDSIHLFGRLHELSMLAEYKLLSLDLVSDPDMGLDMFLNGKIHPLPKRIKGMDQIKKLYELRGKRR
jgi:heterodisulfide reductase subunit C